MKKFILFSFGLWPLSIFSSALSDLAATMKAGEWKQLSTLNILPTLKANGASGCVMGGYHEDAGWDPNTLEFHTISGDHNWGENTSQWITYSAADNTWKTQSRPSWLGIQHGYDHNAINPATGDLYHRHYGVNNYSAVYKLTKSTGTWAGLPAIPYTNDYLSCCGAAEYFPDMNGLLYANTVATPSDGAVYLFSETTKQWTTLARPYLGNGYAFAEYNPVLKIMLVGGGREVYKIDAQGKLTDLQQAPVNLGVMSSLTTVDPVSGDHLIFTKGGAFYAYDVFADTWKIQSGTVPFFTPTRVDAIWHTVAAPVTTYGVVMFVKYYAADPNSQAWVYLYKHAAGTGKESIGLRANGKGRISISPNPVTGGCAAVRAPGRATVHDARGRQVARLAGNGIWNASGFPSGIYLVRVRAEGRIISLPVYVQH